MTEPPRGAAPRTSFWQSMAGMLTAVAALITALVGVAAFLHQVTGGGSAAPPATRSSASSAPPRAAGQETSPPPVTAPEGAAAGPFDLLFNNNGVDLDADPPRVATRPDTGIDIYDGGGSIQSYPVWAGLARWSRAGTPTREDCLALLNGFATIDSTYRKGSRYCVHTREEVHVAFVEFVAPVEAGWKIRVTVWPGTAD
ncbi:hypothetical protein [Micromonospora robiginosa]|uniref:Uncharacterized protein n=1 Tax=Micromonospora robiginosa TaxID=2749844 RepID=A0A7L6B5R7_9ACTN|nr:hypothetical protein [Micromonospora ferruginea]QLQ37296.1 hypothetical protein H1D33_29460 [Micromonospora ferruginea]